MTLESIYYASQTLAVVGLIASLLFVGKQVRQNSKSMRLSAYQTAQERLDNIREAIAVNADVAAIYTQGLADPVRLDDQQLVRFRMLIFDVASAMQTLHVLSVQSGINPAEWDRLIPTARRVFGSPGGRAWWALFRREVDSGFAEAVDALLEDGSQYEHITHASWDSVTQNGRRRADGAPTIQGAGE